jgi:hypothetical protein
VKRYKVTGTQAVLGGKLPGSVFEEDIDPGVEKFLLGISAIEVVPEPEPKPKPEPDPEPAKKVPEASKKTPPHAKKA